MNRRSFLGWIGKALAALWITPKSIVDTESVECKVDVEVGPFDPRWSVSIRVNGGGWLFVGEGSGSVVVENGRDFNFSAGRIHGVRHLRVKMGEEV